MGFYWSQSQGSKCEESRNKHQVSTPFKTKCEAASAEPGSLAITVPVLEKKEEEQLQRRQVAP